jgi:hypothetical protein
MRLARPALMASMRYIGGPELKAQEALLQWLNSVLARIFHIDVAVDRALAQVLLS